ncbi:MAG: TonB-dependent receptor plug domain-containing protein [Woeseiaceae bacterium]|nr:TonB-dependent receptor plug domain-containing protein [Woeseiaceae bacterium]
MKFAGRSMLCGAVTTALVGAFSIAVPLATQAQELEEITVIARKKDESLQDVPLAVSAITADMVQRMGLQDLDDIAKMTAGLLFDTEFDRTSNRPVIRGQANILGSSGVSYFIDGVYITGSINDYDINDVERVEIVKGPQSALYGRNTYSGAINIVTKAPGDTWATRAQVKTTDDGMSDLSASIRGPVTNNLGIGLSARYYNHDGAFTNTFDGSDIGEQESSSLSANAVFSPSENFTARFRAYYAETRDGQTPLIGIPHSENNCFPDNGSLYAGGGRYYCGVLQPRPVNSDWTVQAPDSKNDRDLTQFSLSMDWQLSDNWSLASVTGYNTEDAVFISEADYQPTQFQTAVFARFPTGFPFPTAWAYVGTMVDFTFASADDIEDLSQEFRLRYVGERSEFLIGAYYFDQDSATVGVRELPPNAQAIAAANYGATFAEQQAWCTANFFICTGITPFFGPTVAVNNTFSEINTQNSALFGMAAFDIGDASRLTIEARFAEEELTRNRTTSATFRSFSPRITFDHRLSDDHMVYVLYAEGTKPGGFNSDLAASQNKGEFEEEEVESIEVGSKSTGLDGRLVANVSLFLNQVTGYQLTQNVRAGANTTSATVNAGDADIFGAEIELRYAARTVDGLNFTFNYAFTDAEFVAGTDENIGLLIDVNDDGLVNCSAGDEFPEISGCTASAFGSLVGNQVPRTAEHQIFLDAELRRPMGSGDWEWYLGANGTYESSKFAQVVNEAETGSTTLINARFGMQNDRYGFSLWGKNLTGEDSTTLALRYADGADSFKRSFVIMPRRDTYWGLTANVNFE